MGYYTLHRIRIINQYNTEENLEILLDYIEKISGYSFHISDSVIKDYYDEEYMKGINGMNAKIIWKQYQDFCLILKFK